MSAIADQDRCPRCGGLFHCGARDPVPCPCAGVTLAPSLLAALRSRYEGCLCLNCLREWADAGIPAAARAAGASDPAG